MREKGKYETHTFFYWKALIGFQKKGIAMYFAGLTG